MQTAFARLVSRKTVTCGALTAVGIYTYSQISNPHLLEAKPRMTTTYAQPKSWLGTRTLKVKSIEDINHDTKRITFSLPGGNSECSGVPVSGAILTIHQPKGKWIPVLRPYTPVSDRDVPGTLQLVVKKYPGGKASTHLHNLKVDDTLTTKGPIPGYAWKASDQSRDVLLIAGGAGITPIYSLAKGILTDKDNAKDKTRIHLVWGVNGARDIVLKKELEELQQKDPERLKITYAVTDETSIPASPDGQVSSPDDDKGTLNAKTTYFKGRVNKELLNSIISQYKPEEFGDKKGTKVWMCGPPAMEDALAVTGKGGVLGELGLTKKNIYRF